MAGLKTSKKGKGSRKIGRNLKKCLKYLSERRRIKNKTRKFKSSIKNLKKETQERLLKTITIKRRKEER